ncbi:MAG: TIR domain-containing protein [Candidatus Accumulibacter meliphilus]|jgi:formylglycine-generating enzyme required for sulfatase activity|uniref:TIR domain-containing protein n=1 Tax=Candidatus Accumulibacter meliphilus TaxID=2211374 RepID=A0A369XQ18_9PROT|nr:MAG: TIR domain-containing protein [Candidatus Accumulibacter meliphilus]
MPPNSPQTTEHVFLSYSHGDQAAAIVLRDALETAKLSVFKDDDSLHGGDRWMERLQQVLASCSAFVVLVGRDGVRRWVGAEVEVALNRHLSSEKDDERLPIFPILLEEAAPETLPPLLALFQASRWTAADALPPAGLVAAICAHAIRLDSPPAIEGCPFVGLNAFTSKDARLFFGRRRETLEALTCLGNQQQANPEALHGGGGGAYFRWLQIEGNSGTGKSSLVNAGMLPMIEQGALWARTGFEHWTILGPMMPGENPLTRLVDVVEHGLISEGLRHMLARQQAFEHEHDERALAFALRDCRKKQSAFLLIVDQFEELFTFANAAASKQFDALLANALQDADCPLFLISTVRADFLDRFERLPRLQAIYNSHCKRYFLPAISEHGLREIIEQPARLAGLDVSEVSAAIIEEARNEIGALPLVENALFTLWDQRQGKKVLSGERYIQLKGIAGMLSTQADALLARIGGPLSKDRQGALELLLRLTRINDEGRHTRQRIPREEALMIAGDDNPAVGERVLQLLSGERRVDAPAEAPAGALRVLTVSTEQQRQYVDLIHETLIRARGKDEQTGKEVGYWPTLYDYIENNRDRDVLRQQLRFQTEQWGKSGVVGRWWNLAGWQDLWRYRRLRVDQSSDEGRFVFRSRWKVRAQFLVLALLFAFVGGSYMWTREHSLPLDYMALQQRYRLGYAPVPELLPISAGSLDMGEQNKAFVKELPKEKWPDFGVPGIHVEIRQGFNLAKHEVTYEEFDYYVWEQHRAGNSAVVYPTTAKGGRGTRPVVNISWHEARAYTEWLGKHIKKTCRLPSEAEWEHAARAKTITAYPWGDDIPRSGGDKEGRLAKCRNCSSTGGDKQSAPVGSFPGNGFCIHDTSGNVWEWTCSLWREQFDGNEQNCVVPEESQPTVVRGGSWESGADYARSAARDYRGPTSAFPSVGFRPLCEFPNK